MGGGYIYLFLNNSPLIYMNNTEPLLSGEQGKEVLQFNPSNYPN
jgi:hypothetical protein